MRRVAAHVLAAVVALLLAAGLASCDLPGHSTGNGLQKVSNGIP